MDKKPKKGIAGAIKRLLIGEATTFPLERYASVNSCIYLIEITTGKKFSRERTGKRVIVSRIK